MEGIGMVVMTVVCAFVCAYSARQGWLGLAGVAFLAVIELVTILLMVGL